MSDQEFAKALKEIRDYQDYVLTADFKLSVDFKMENINDTVLCFMVVTVNARDRHAFGFTKRDSYQVVLEGIRKLCYKE